MKNTLLFRRALLSLAFLLPFLLLMGAFAVRGIAPFGGKSLAILDAKEQYISFSVFLADTLKSGNSLFYSWKLLLGGPTAGMIGYYLASPLELLFLLFPQEGYLAVFDLIIALKLSLSGLTMALWLREKSDSQPSVLLFSTAYALCGFSLVFGWCVMWLDAVYLLPLVALGLNRIADGKRAFLYLISLGAAIIMNYYTGYMLCVFSVLYYGYLRISENHGRKMLQQDGLFCLSSIAAALLAAGVLFPVAVAMQGSTDLSFFNAIREYTYPAMTRLLQLLLPALPKEAVDRLVLPALLGTAIVFAGFLILAFRACLNTSMPLRHRLLWILIFVLAVELWHGFVDSAVISEEYGQDPSGTWGLYKLFFGEADIEEIYSGGPNVYVGPLLLLLSCLYFSLDGVSHKQKGAAGVILLVYYLSFTLHFPNRIWHLMANNHMFGFRYSFSFSFFLVIFAEESWRRRKTLDRKKILFTATVLLTAGVLCFLARQKKGSDPREMLADLFLLLVAGVALFLYGQDNRRLAFGLCALVQICAMLWTVNANYIVQAENALGQEEFLQIKNEADVRLQTLRSLDNGLFRARDTKDWLNMNDPLQFAFLGVSSFSSSEKASTTSFMSRIGVYSMVSRFSDGNRGMSRAADSLLGVRYLFSPYEDYQEACSGVWQNPYALNLAYVAPKAAAEADAAENAAETLNSFFGVFGCGPVYSGLEPIEIQREQHGAVYSYNIPEEEYWYLQFDSPVPEQLEIVADGKSCSLSRNAEEYHGNMLYPLGRLSKGTSLQIRTEDDENPLPEVLLYSEDSGVLKDVHSKTEENPTEIEFISDDHIKVLTEVQTEGNMLIVSIPAEKSWRVTVDGVETETETAYGLFLSVPVTKGNHVVDLRYRPQEVGIGLAVSCLTVLGIAACAVLEKSVSKKGVIRKERVENAVSER